MSSKNERIERCYTDNLYLIESLPIDVEHPLERSFIIMGNSGNTYQVTISNYPKCTCPDNQNKGRRCKHIFFVLLRIMNITITNRRKFSDNDLVSMYINIPAITKELMYQGEKPQEKEGVEQKFDEGDLCPICLDLLENGKELDYCKYSCGKTIHKQCYSMWEKTRGKICVYCRGNWLLDGSTFHHHKKVSMHPIKKNEKNINNDKNPDNNSNNNETNDEEENYNEINDKINLILQNACRDKEDEKNKIKKPKRKRGRRKKNKKGEEFEENDLIINGRKSRSRSKDNINI